MQREPPPACCALQWWIAGACVLRPWINDANNNQPPLPNTYWRNVLQSLSWAMVGLFAGMVLVSGPLPFV